MVVAFRRMQVADFNYHLPAELIAQYPSDKRTDSRLLQMDKQGAISDLKFPDLCQFLRAGDLLVLNNTRVVPARLFARKDTGGKIEVLLERVLDETRFLAQVRASKAPRVGQQLVVDDQYDTRLSVVGRQSSFFELQFDADLNLFDWLEEVGHMPLPPYIERADENLDQERYQTVFAEQRGAVAAPTAGLHFDAALLAELTAKGVQIQTLTLHVGAGTYQPVRVDTIEQHHMHAEYIEVGAELCEAIIETKLAGGRVCAVGTTVVRSLETAARASTKQLIEPYSGDTDIFIYPGFEFKVVDILQTNFHLPESTLLMLVSAFAGYAPIMHAYQHAIDQKYRFFSYGDAMLLERSA